MIEYMLGINFGKWIHSCDDIYTWDRIKVVALGKIWWTPFCVISQRKFEACNDYGTYT